MSDHAAAESLAIVDVEINLGDRKLCTKMAVPATPMRLMELLPILQQVANAVVDSGVADAEAAGRTIACQKGCGACCRQLVPISEVEAHRIRDLVDEMPEPRRSHVRQRFDEARQKLAAGGLWEKLRDRGDWTEETFLEMGTHYFYQGIPCPFLEDESCSIHPDRPLTCREYLVTSPPANCATPRKDNIDKVEMPVQVWTALARFAQNDPAAKYIRWVPLVMAPEWADSHPDTAPLRPGPELLREFFEHLTGKKAPGAAEPLPSTATKQNDNPALAR
jgi:Fe-S-cluster containining protein